MINLNFSLYAAYDSGENRHPQDVMRGLGITYAIATPQSIFDSWWFWGCENVPETLPAYLTPLKRTPEQAIGHGLGPDDVAHLRQYYPDNAAPSPDP